MTYVRILVACGVAGVVMWLLVAFFHMALSFAAAWSILAGLVILALQLVLPEDPRSDAPRIEMGPQRRGTDIARMAWSINPRTGAAGALLTGRVRRVLAHRLARVGLDTENPDQRAQIEALVGAGVWDRLVQRGTTQKDIERALDAIARLSPNKEKI